jgi:hypothetical protein
MPAQYNGEVSNLKIRNVLFPFICGNVRNSFKRIIYNYFLRDFNIASMQLIGGLSLLIAGITFGTVNWIANARAGIESSPGTVMLAGLPIIVGFQMLLAFLNFDVQSVPRSPIHRGSAIRRASLPLR